jgi:hypothetical protein
MMTKDRILTNPLPLVFLLCLLGCAEGALIIDDTTCTPAQIVTIEEALRMANSQLYDGRQRLTVSGYGSRPFGVDDGVDVISCGDGSDVLGWFLEDDIRLYQKGDDADFKFTVLHEIGHYVSGRLGHCTSNDCCVMVEFLPDSPTDRYCDGDIEFLLK